MIHWLVHFFSYNIAWISCVYFAALGQPYTGPIITGLLLLTQILWQHHYKLPWKGPLIFALYIAFLGALLDSFWLWQHFIIFKANPFGLSFSPPWMIALWLSFSFNLFFTLKPILKHYKTLGLLMFVSLPLAYWIGIEIGAAVLLSGRIFYVFLGGVWALLLPGQLYIYQQYFESRFSK